MNRPITRHRTIVICSLILVLIILPVLSACNFDSSELAGTAASTDQVSAALAALQAESEGPLDIEYYAPTGAARWAEAEGGVLTRQFARQSLTADAVAMAFLTTYGSIFGVSDAANVLQLTETETDESGAQHVGFSQQQNGVDVFATKLLVHLDNEGAVEVVNGYTVPDADTVNTTPTLDAATAAQAAIAHTVITDGVAAESYLEIFNPGLITDEVTPTYLVYRIRVDSPSQPELAQWVFVDAHTGEIRYSYDAVTEGRNRNTYNRQRSSSGGTLARGETAAAVTAAPNCTPADVNNAHDFAGQTYDFYKNRFGRDSYDGTGSPLNSYVCHGNNYRNAYWDGSSMTYGQGYALDDVVGHELSHAVTEYISGLVYGGQSGGLNESFSDIMGEALDITNGSANDTAAVRWDMGEELPTGGAIRDLMDPERFGSQMKGTAGAWVCSTDVHYSSAVQNKAFALMVDGGTYNGYTISPIGVDKAVQVIYRAHDRYLPRTAKFVDAYNAINRSCSELYPLSVTCANVQKALLATNMHGAICGGTAAPATEIIPLLNPDFEDRANTSWSSFDSVGQITIRPGVGENSSWAAWLGGFDSQTNEIWQRFTVPLNGGTLLYSYRISSQDVPNWDYAYVLVNDVQMVVYNLATANNTNGFVQGSVNLAAYAGQIVTLKFRLKSDSSLPSNFYIDNLRFAPVGFSEPVDPRASTEDAPGEPKTDVEPTTEIESKTDETAPETPVEQLKKLFLPLINN